MDQRLNEYAHVLLALQKKGMKLAVITGRSMGLKGRSQTMPYELMGGTVPVHRLFRNSLDMLYFPQRKLKEIQTIVKNLNPDLIFCSQELNMPLALMINKMTNVPIVVLVENAGGIFSGDIGKGLGLPSKFGLFLNRIGPVSGFWAWLCKNSSALITCNPKDISFLKILSSHKKPVYYVPWPTYFHQDLPAHISKERFRGVYIGSLYPFKNTHEFKITLPRILKETNTREFIVVGSGPHAKLIKSLQETTHNAVKYVEHLSREQALLLIASSYYGYTPVIGGGWGFIEDCWSINCPIVMTHNDSFVEDKVNALVASSEDDLIRNINRLNLMKGCRRMVILKVKEETQNS